MTAHQSFAHLFITNLRVNSIRDLNVNNINKLNSLNVNLNETNSSLGVDWQPLRVRVCDSFQVQQWCVTVPLYTCMGIHVNLVYQSIGGSSGDRFSRILSLYNWLL